MPSKFEVRHPFAEDTTAIGEMRESDCGWTGVVAVHRSTSWMGWNYTMKIWQPVLFTGVQRLHSKLDVRACVCFFTV